jgi:predicted phage tail component-like protein
LIAEDKEDSKGMTIKESMFFSFNGQNCRDFGIVHVAIDSGMQDEPFTPSRKRIEHKIRGNHRPYLLDIEYEPLQIPIRLYLEESLTSEKLREIANWLTTEDYAPLIFDSKKGHIYYAMLVDEGTLTHNNNSQGYLSLVFGCDGPWAWTPAYSQFCDFSTNPQDGTPYSIVNKGDLPTQPIVEVEVVSGDNFSITNTSNGGEALAFNGLAAGEKLIIDCLNKTIQTDIPGIYRYSSRLSDSRFLTLLKGNNQLIIKGKIKATFKYRSQLRG